MKKILFILLILFPLSCWASAEPGSYALIYGSEKYNSDPLLPYRERPQMEWGNRGGFPAVSNTGEVLQTQYLYKAFAVTAVCTEKDGWVGAAIFDTGTSNMVSSSSILGSPFEPMVEEVETAYISASSINPSNYLGTCGVTCKSEKASLDITCGVGNWIMTDEASCTGRCKGPCESKAGRTITVPLAGDESYQKNICLDGCSVVIDWHTTPDTPTYEDGTSSTWSPTMKKNIDYLKGTYDGNTCANLNDNMNNDDAEECNDRRSACTATCYALGKEPVFDCGTWPKVGGAVVSDCKCYYPSDDVAANTPGDGPTDQAAPPVADQETPSENSDSDSAINENLSSLINQGNTDAQSSADRNSKLDWIGNNMATSVDNQVKGLDIMQSGIAIAPESIAELGAAVKGYDYSEKIDQANETLDKNQNSLEGIESASEATKDAILSMKTDADVPDQPTFDPGLPGGDIDYNSLSDFTTEMKNRATEENLHLDVSVDNPIDMSFSVTNPDHCISIPFKGHNGQACLDKPAMMNAYAIMARVLMFLAYWQVGMMINRTMTA